ncbi:tetratricopeptide repeat protein [bacterium]|nr:tetratricopeptide repeat protein [bacterium]
MTSRALLIAVMLAFAALCHADEAPERQHILQLLAAGRNGEALTAAREWTTAHPDSPEALLLYATVQNACADIEGAIDSLDSAYFLTRDVNVLVRKGQVYLDSGQYARAESAFQEALRQQESCVAAHVGLAQVMMERNHALEAGASLKAALAIDPKSVQALVIMAKLRMTDGEPQAARELLQQALQVDPRAPQAYLSLGQIAAEAGNMAQARDYWRKYTELDPGSPAQWQLSHNLYPIASRPFECTGFYPTFSRDGKRVAYRGRGDAGSVYLSDVDNLAVYERVYQGNGNLYSLEWSPDGKYMLCRDYLRQEVQGKPEFTYRLFVVPVAPGQTDHEARKLYEGRYIGAPCWLPDSQSIVFDGYIAGKGRPLLRLPIAASATPAEPQVALMPERDESFSGCLALPGQAMPADGSLPKLLLHRWHVPTREYQVVLVDPRDRRQDRILVHSTQSLYYLAVSADGSTLLYYRRNGQPPSWSLVAQALAEDGPGRALPFRTTMPMPPALTADGKHLVLYQQQGLYMVDLVGVKE